MAKAKESITDSMIRRCYVQEIKDLAEALLILLGEVEGHSILDKNLMLFMLLNKRMAEALRLALQLRDQVLVDNGISIAAWETGFVHVKKGDGSDG